MRTSAVPRIQSGENSRPVRVWTTPESSVGFLVFLCRPRRSHAPSLFHVVCRSLCILLPDREAKENRQRAEAQLGREEHCLRPPLGTARPRPVTWSEAVLSFKGRGGERDRERERSLVVVGRKCMRVSWRPSGAVMPDPGSDIKQTECKGCSREVSPEALFCKPRCNGC